MKKPGESWRSTAVTYIYVFSLLIVRRIYTPRVVCLYYNILWPGTEYSFDAFNGIIIYTRSAATNYAVHNTTKCINVFVIRTTICTSFPCVSCRDDVDFHLVIGISIDCSIQIIVRTIWPRHLVKVRKHDDGYLFSDWLEQKLNCQKKKKKQINNKCRFVYSVCMCVRATEYTLTHAQTVGINFYPTRQTSFDVWRRSIYQRWLMHK